MDEAALDSAIQPIPPGAWAVGVSGGADSVALLSLLRRRAELKLTVAHLDHETRSGASAADAEFVRSLARQSGFTAVIAQRRSIEAQAPRLPGNLSARFRALRLLFFADVVRAHDLQGVVLAHQADDQAETVFLRLLRGAGPSGLAGMAPRSVIRGLALLRPLLGVRRQALREYLIAHGIAWREDESNESSRYGRNRVRRMLASHPHVHEELMTIATTARRWRTWLRAVTPGLAESFELIEARPLPDAVRREALRGWLVARGAPFGDVTPAVVARLEAMIDDAASPARQHFPGRLLIRRRAGRIFIDS